MTKDHMVAGPHPPPLDLGGVTVRQGWFDPAAQAALVEDIRAVARAAPFFRPVTPRGRPMSVRMTAAGRYGWVSDRKGLSYAFSRLLCDKEPLPGTPNMPGSGGGRIENGSATGAVR